MVIIDRDNVLVQGVSGDKNSLGYFGYSFFIENQDILKMVAIDGGNGCILPTDETINDNSYAPLSRPLFIYVTKEASLLPDVQDFVRFYVNYDRGELLKELGFVPYSPRVYALGLERFDNLITGTIFGGENRQIGPVEQVLAAGR